MILVDTSAWVDFFRVGRRFATPWTTPSTRTKRQFCGPVLTDADFVAMRRAGVGIVLA